MVHSLFAAARRRLFFAGAAILSLVLALAPRAGAGASQQNDTAKINIGIIGSGNIGGTVGALWVKAGHPVLFSSRHPEEIQKLVDGLGARARAGTVRAALEFGEVILIAVPYGAYPQIGADYAGRFRGKIVLDAGNAVPGRDGDIVTEADKNGIGITSAKYLAGARIVRAFNTLNYQILLRQANRPGRRLAIPIAGDDKEALTVASRLVRDAGFDPVIVGSLRDAQHFARGAPLYGQEITADEMQQRLKTLR
jgi:predicted dinucleotide-binding enzyme